MRTILFDRSKTDDLATEGEIGQMRSVIGSLGCIARQCRLDISLGVSQVQSTVNSSTMRNLKLVNQAPGQAKEFKSEGSYFDSNALDWDTTRSRMQALQTTFFEPDGKLEATQDTDGVHEPVGEPGHSEE